MAFQKNITLKSGSDGNYVKITALNINELQKTASVHFGLYKNQSMRQSAPASPILPIIAKVRLSGDKFDQYFSSAALTNSNHYKQAYIAARKENTTSDWTMAGGSLFGDAQDVLEPDQ